MAWKSNSSAWTSMGRSHIFAVVSPYFSKWNLARRAASGLPSPVKAVVGQLVALQRGQRGLAERDALRRHRHWDRGRSEREEAAEPEVQVGAQLPSALPTPAALQAGRAPFTGLVSSASVRHGRGPQPASGPSEAPDLSWARGLRAAPVGAEEARERRRARPQLLRHTHRDARGASDTRAIGGSVFSAGEPPARLLLGLHAPSSLSPFLSGLPPLAFAFGFGGGFSGFSSVCAPG